MVAVDLPHGLPWRMKKCQLWEDVGLLGGRSGRPAPACGGVGQQQIAEAALGIAGEPGPGIDQLYLDGDPEGAEDGADQIHVQPGVAAFIQPLQGAAQGCRQ